MRKASLKMQQLKGGAGRMSRVQRLNLPDRGNSMGERSGKQVRALGVWNKKSSVWPSGGGKSVNLEGEAEVR